MIRRLSASIQSPFRNRGKRAADEDAVEDTAWSPSRKPPRRSSSAVSSGSSNSSGRGSVNSALTTPPSSPDITAAVEKVMSGVNSTDYMTKNGFSHDQILEALRNLDTISAGAEAVAGHLTAIVRNYEVWRKDNYVLRSLAPFKTEKCAKCEVEGLKEQVCRMGGPERVHQKIAKIKERQSAGGYLTGEDINIINLPKRWERRWREANAIAGGDSKPSLPSTNLESRINMFSHEGKGKGKERAIEGQEPIESTPSPPPNITTTPLCPDSLRRCEYCPIKCISTQLRTQSPIAYTSQRCIGATAANSKNDIHHLTFSHLALKVTLNRIVSSSEVPKHKAMLKNSESLVFGRRPMFAGFPYQFDEVRETVMYWLDFHRVQQDWGWIFPCAQPNNWDEVRELCQREVEKAYYHGRESVLEEYSARLIHLGPMMKPGDLYVAYKNEDNLNYQVLLSVKELRQCIGWVVDRDWRERKEYEDSTPTRAGVLAEKCANGFRQRTSIVTESFRSAFSRNGKRRLSEEAEAGVDGNA
jgi:hypothetical protein